ncbi:MAG TPA: T9SS type A sorting domain-containing protein, partial [Ignavibacteriaceae bacterium]
ALNDSDKYTDFSAFYYSDISKQNSLNTYGGNGSLVRSFDGGLTYPQDSILNFHMISVSDFNDKMIFGIDDNNNLIKSFDGGRTSIIVDDNPVYETPYFNPKIYYDTDQSHIYRTNKSVSYNLYVSDDNGNSYTWELQSEYPQPFVFANDQSASGTCYLAYYYNLYKSTDFAGSFSPLYHFDEKIVGIYPKPGTQILYVATKYHLYQLENNNLTVLKEILPDPELVRYYPLQVGNLWLYNGFVWSYPFYDTYQFVRQINDEVIKPNQLKYYEVEEYYAGSSYSEKYYERIDSVNAKVYRYNEDSVQSNQEYLIDDLRAEVGDSVPSYRFDVTPYTVIYSADTTLYQLDTHFKEYNAESLFGYTYNLVKDFGITYEYMTFDFGSDDRILKGAVLNGIVYGDTTITGIKDEINPVNTFLLFQNYPNPFNPVTNIKYQIPKTSFITLKVYDVLGNEVAVLVNEEKPAGSYIVQFDGSDLASGVYFSILKSGGNILVRKLLLLK